jgi:hypothetical protein
MGPGQHRSLFEQIGRSLVGVHFKRFQGQGDIQLLNIPGCDIVMNRKDQMLGSNQYLDELRLWKCWCYGLERY